MKQATEERTLAYEALLAIERNGKQSHLVIPETAEKLRSDSKKDHPEQGEAFLRRLIRGTVETRLQLDYVIDRFSRTPTSKMKPQIRTILRMAVYQILHMDAVPDRAAVDEAVTLTVQKGFAGLRGFVNGVLRTVVREKESIEWPAPEKGPEKRISVLCSVPEETVRVWTARYGAEETEAICASFLEERPIWLHRIIDHKTGETGKASGGMPAEILRKEEDLQDPACFVQDLSSQLAVYSVGICPGDAVLDLCAAPGGKTMLAAECCAIKRDDSPAGTHPSAAFSHAGRVLARDVNMEKVQKIRENLVRCHVDNVDLALGDATVFDPALEGRFDVVIADLPCSGYGVAGKKPEIKYKPYRETVDALAALQKEILAHAVRYVKPGGKLLYSTCTIAVEENEENREWLLKTYDGKGKESGGICLEKVDITQNIPSLPKIEGLEQDQVRGRADAGTLPHGYLQLLPSQGPWDGFFFAVFKRTV